MRQRRYIPMLLMAALCVALSSCSISARIRKADKKMAIGEYYEAAEMYRKCYKSLKGNKDLRGQVAYKQAECYRYINNPRAAAAYANAIKNKYQDSTVYLHYAQVLAYQGKYKDADKMYVTYLEAHPDDYVALGGHAACMRIDDLKKQTTRYQIREAKEFNKKKSSNFAPMFVGQNGDAVVFTSNRTETKKGDKKNIKRPSPVTGANYFNLYSARRNAAGKWEDLEVVDGLFGEAGEEGEGEQKNDSTQQAGGNIEVGACCFTQDGKTMYYTYSRPINGQDLGAKIYMSSRASGQWGEGQEVELFADSSITVGHPALSITGDTLYFATDAPGGLGGKDIWMAEQDGGKWVNPQPVGGGVNTTANELYPYVHADGTLYFASNGHPGYGGLDIYKAVRDTMVKDSLVYEVINMGLPFNSNGDDFGITFEGKTQNGMFSSNRGAHKGLDLIYAFELPEMEFAIEGKVVDNQGEAVADASIRLIGDDGTATRMQVRRDGSYKMKLKKDVRYAMLATARGHLNEQHRFTTLNLADSKLFEHDFTLAQISKPVTMDNVFYEFGKWQLTKDSEAGLQSLVKMLKDNPNITIELSAHTDMKGDSIFNQKLSEQRAKAVCDYLIAAGIESARLTPVGYGKYKPVVADKTLHDKYTFIPQDQVLNEAFILSLSPDQQEICNQINRRTEFKVLKTTYKLY